MVIIEKVDKLNEEMTSFMKEEFQKHAESKGITSSFSNFAFLAKDEDKVIGVLTGHAYEEEVHVSNLVIEENYRHLKIGSRLLKEAENYFREKGFKIMELTTYEFQARSFYEKNGFKVEFKRENKQNPKLAKYFLIKSLD